MFFSNVPKLMTRLHRQLEQPGPGHHGVSVTMDQSSAAAQAAAAALVSFPGDIGCGVFYLGLATLVVVYKNHGRRYDRRMDSRDDYPAREATLDS